MLVAGGRLIEQHGEARTRLLLFGAGHVGRALILALAPLPFTVDWIDPRPDAFPRHVPQNVRAIGDVAPERLIAEAGEGAIVLAMTHSHALDLEIATAALVAGRFPLVGVIGSATKRARFTSQMRQAGLARDIADRLVCPIGLPEIAGKEPATIAASVAAQCLMIREAQLSKTDENDGASRLAPSQGAADRL
jgi:xanthine dehydrogenase accessory factor